MTAGSVLDFASGTATASSAPGITGLDDADAGLAKGHELFVYRSDGKGKYLGKIRLDYVDYKTAVGVVVQSTKNGQIQVGDNVTTKL